MLAGEMKIAVVAACVALASPAAARLRKAELRPGMKTIGPRLTACYEQAHARDPRVRGVVNVKLTIRNEPWFGAFLYVDGFETHGPLGESREFLACVKTTFESTVLPPVDTRDSLAVTYPLTFSPDAPDNHDRAIVDNAARAEQRGRWREAIELAARGLTSTSLDGPHRRRLISIAGRAACNAGDEAQARRYWSLASPEFEDGLQAACAKHAIDLVGTP
jgi:hypothetical protein